MILIGVRPVPDCVELRDGVLVGGTRLHMGKFEAAELKGVDLIIKFEFIRLLRKMLLRFNADATDVSATERYYVIQDGVLRFGFERYSFHFPGISVMYQHRCKRRRLPQTCRRAKVTMSFDQ